MLARNGSQALLTFPPASPDVVILDIRLPDSDGRDLCLALRANGVSAPVLMLTALDGVHDKLAGFESGADDYLTRPLGASIGDGMSQPTGDGGLGLGTTVTSMIFLAVILALVVYLSVTRVDRTENKAWDVDELDESDSVEA